MVHITDLFDVKMQAAAAATSNVCHLGADVEHRLESAKRT